MPATYTVKQGDTLSSIARAAGATLAEMVAANPALTSADEIAVGQVLILPEHVVAAVAAGPHVNLVIRSEWGAKPIKGEPGRLGRVTNVTVHHTATPVLPKTREQGIAQARAVQAIHQGQGWADTGYHALLDQAGTFYEGRAPRSGHIFGADADLRNGSHVLSHNLGNIGVSVLGFFHAPKNHKMSDAATIALRHGLRRLLELHSLDAKDIMMHQEWRGARTACPGDTLIPVVRQIRSEL